MIDLEQDKSDVKMSEDNVGGSTYIKNADVYDAEVQLCYYGESAGGAAFLDWEFKLKGAGFYNERIYFSKTKANNQSFKYEDKDGEEHYLPGYETNFNMTMAAVGKELVECIKEGVAAGPKTLKLYDYAQGKKVDTEVEAVLPVQGATMQLCIKKYRKPNSVKTTDDKGKQVYADSANETRESNEIALVCVDDGRTYNEVVKKKTEAVVRAEWIEVWKGKTHTIKAKKKFGIEPIESEKGKPIAEANAAVAAFGGGEEEAAPAAETSALFGE
jgi:hypothetical protein